MPDTFEIEKNKKRPASFAERLIMTLAELDIGDSFTLSSGDTNATFSYARRSVYRQAEKLGIKVSTVVEPVFVRAGESAYRIAVWRVR